MGKLFDRVRKHIQDKALEREQEWRDAGVLTDAGVAHLNRVLDKKLANPRYFMNISGDNLNKVFKSDQFKNQFSTKHSGGVYDKDMRAAHTNKHFGTPVEVDCSNSENAFKTNTKALKDSEKYGWATTDFFIPNRIHPDHSDTGGYGEYIVEFRPKNVGDRATVHFGDSLEDNLLSIVPGDHSTYAATLPKLGEKGFADNYVLKGERWWSLPDMEDYSPERRLISGVVGSRANDAGELLEAQYHGRLSPEDVQTIFYDRNSIPESFKNEADRLGIRLEDFGGCYRNCDDPDYPFGQPLIRDLESDPGY